MDDQETPESFWANLLASNPDRAYELLLAAPKLAKWKTSPRGVEYLDHVRVETMSRIVSVAHDAAHTERTSLSDEYEIINPWTKGRF
jgi:hypothetical protein